MCCVFKQKTAYEMRISDGSSDVCSSDLVAHDLGAKLIAVWCRSGRTARWISKYRMPQPLVGLATEERVCRQLAMSYGVFSKVVTLDQISEECRVWNECVSPCRSRWPPHHSTNKTRRQSTLVVTY